MAQNNLPQAQGHACLWISAESCACTNVNPCLFSNSAPALSSPLSVYCLGGALSDSGLLGRRELFRVGNRSFCLWRQAIINSWEEGRVFTLSKLHELQPPLGGDNISHIPNEWVTVGRGKLNGCIGGAWTIPSDQPQATCFPLKFLL